MGNGGASATIAQMRRRTVSTGPVTAAPIQVHEAEGYRDPQHGHHLVDALFGRTLTDAQIGGLVGAQPGDQVTISGYHAPGGAPVVTLELRGGGYHGMRSLERRDGLLTMHNETFRVAAQGQGVGTRIFARQVAALRRAGVQQILTTGTGYGPQSAMAAARSGAPSRENGYYTWARLGYNGTLSEAQRQGLPAAYQGARTLHDLMGQPGGAQVWREYGSEMPMTFDLMPGSTSLQVLSGYLRERGR